VDAEMDEIGVGHGGSMGMGAESGQWIAEAIERAADAGGRASRGLDGSFQVYQSADKVRGQAVGLRDVDGIAALRVGGRIGARLDSKPRAFTRCSRAA
jgi:hypothetical protein